MALRSAGCHPSTFAAACLAPLSLSHISASTENVGNSCGTVVGFTEKLAKRSACSIRFRKGSNCVVVKCRQQFKSKCTPPEDSAVRTFSAQSRGRLLKLVNSFDRSICEKRTCVMITLTYGRAWPHERGVWKRQLDNFRRDFLRPFGRVACVWKLEPQKRGAPHFHLIAFFPLGTNVSSLSSRAARIWNRLVEHSSGSQRRLHRSWHLGRLGNGNQPCCQVIRSLGGVIAYASKAIGSLPAVSAARKYVSKAADDGALCSEYGEWSSPGRFWGIWNKSEILSSESVHAVDEVAATYLRRCMRRYLQRRDGNRPRGNGWVNVGAPSFTGFVPESITSRLIHECMPWKILGVSFLKFRDFEIACRRKQHLLNISRDFDGSGLVAESEFTDLYEPCFAAEGYEYGPVSN
jgi:hypothetical protein